MHKQPAGYYRPSSIYTYYYNLATERMADSLLVINILFGAESFSPSQNHVRQTVHDETSAPHYRP